LVPLLGARVIATAGGDDKLDFCRKIRADKPRYPGVHPFPRSAG
jgi:hypothetical protein